MSFRFLTSVFNYIAKQLYYVELSSIKLKNKSTNNAKTALFIIVHLIDDVNSTKDP